MQSLLREATKLAGLSRVQILDRTQTAALIALSKNTHATPTVGSTVLLCDGGPTSIEFIFYTVVSCAGGNTSLERLRSSGLSHMPTRCSTATDLGGQYWREVPRRSTNRLWYISGTMRDGKGSAKTILITGCKMLFNISSNMAGAISRQLQIHAKLSFGLGG